MQPTVIDIARRILEINGVVTVAAMQSMAYYGQAWSLVLEGGLLFAEEILALPMGVGIRELNDIPSTGFHLYKPSLDEYPIHPLSTAQCYITTKVAEFYSYKTSRWFTEQICSEEPWLKARAGLLVNELGERVITPVSMFDYYRSLPMRSLWHVL